VKTNSVSETLGLATTIMIAIKQVLKT